MAATSDTVTVRNSESADLSTVDINIADIERARTVFVWERAEKPGKAPAKKAAKKIVKKSEESNQSEEVNTEANAS